MHTQRTRHALAAAALLALAATLPGGTAGTQLANLPGGTAIEVSVDGPADGAVLVIPAGLSSIDVPVTGTAAIGAAEPVADTSIVFVLDASGSTDQDSLVDCGPDRNGDGSEDFILDCEVAGIAAAVDAADAQGTVDEYGLVVFAGDNPDGPDAAAADMRALAGSQAFTASAAEVHAVASSAFSDGFGGDGGVAQHTARDVGQYTNFEAAVQQACALAALATNPNVLVLFLSDGFATVGGGAVDDAAACGVAIQAFAVGTPGTNADCDNPGEEGQGSLHDIAAATGGACTEVDDPSQLALVVPAAIESHLQALVLESNAAPAEDLSDDLTAGVLGASGPNSVAYAFTLAGLGPGDYWVRTTASGSDGGGDGAVADAHAFTVVQGVFVDAKPGSCPNPVSLSKNGVIPAAVVGGSIDVSAIDPSTVTLEGVPALRWSVEDVASPYTAGFGDPVSRSDCTAAASDGTADLALKFDAQAVLAAIAPVLPGDVVVVTLSGQFTDGTSFEGQDVLWIRP